MKLGFAVTTMLFTLLCHDVLAQPQITSFNPSVGPVGTEVTIHGKKFGSNQIVYFGAVKTTPSSVDPLGTWLIAKVPLGATYAPIIVTDPTIGQTGWSNLPFLITFHGVHEINSCSFESHVDFTTVSPSPSNP